MDRKSLYLSLQQQLRHYRVHLLLHDEKRARIFFFNPSQERYHTKSIPFLKDKVVKSHGHNWLLLEDAFLSVFYLLNLVTMENLQLPPLQDDLRKYIRIVYILSSPPDSPDCLVLLFFEDFVLFHRIGDSGFTKQKLDYHAKDVILFRGKICYFVNEYETFAIEFVPDSRRLSVTPWIKLNGPSITSPPEILFCVPYFIPFHDELFLVYKMRPRLTNNEVCGFRVFQMDLEKQEWVRTKSIGKKTIFLANSYAHGLCIEASKDEVKKNCIYFLSNDRCYYVFDLEDGGIGTYMPCPLVSGAVDICYFWAVVT